MKKHSEEIVRTSDVIGQKVLNAQRDNIGTIEEIVLGKVEGEARYAVLSFGGILGLGDKLFAIPWKLVSYSPEDEAFILNVSKERLESANGFDKDNWPDKFDENWDNML